MNYAEQFSELQLDLHGVRLPSFSIDNKYKHELGVSEDMHNYGFLRALCEQGLKDKKLPKSSYGERLEYELETLESLGFTDLVILYSLSNFGLASTSDLSFKDLNVSLSKTKFKY